ncbi:MAG: hypothetical protein ACK40O_10555 [Allosphingosinicella sp.]
MEDDPEQGEAAAGEVPAPAEQAMADAQIEDNPQVFILSRELSEVHLLLDNISADPDATISALSHREPPQGLPADWLDQVCRISWPPDPSNRKKADQAALLIRVKDYLNRLAKPASGATIAFTVMVTQKEDDGDVAAPERRPGVDMDETLSRSSLAVIAFPDLKDRAETFRKVMLWMNGLLVLWLLITCLLSWNIAFGNSALGEYAAARTRLANAQKVVDDLEAGRRAAVVAPAATTAGAGGGAGTPVPPVSQPVRQAEEPAASGPRPAYCDRAEAIPPQTVGTRRLRLYESADQHQACRELTQSREQVAAAGRSLGRWLDFWDWLPAVEYDARAPNADDTGPASTAARLAAILGTAVLPVFYGLLGAAAAVLRSLSHKIRTSTLNPRDLSLSLQQLALGAVVGACIGLFIVGGDGESLIGPVALSVSAISFVAGFGVDAVFQALDSLISRLFNIAPAAARGSRSERS